MNEKTKTIIMLSVSLLMLTVVISVIFFRHIIPWIDRVGLALCLMCMGVAGIVGMER